MDCFINYNSSDIDYDELISKILEIPENRQEMISLAEKAVDNIYIENVSVMTDLYYNFSYDNAKLINIDLYSSNINENDVYDYDDEISLIVSTPAKIKCIIDLSLESEQEEENYSKMITTDTYININYNCSLEKNDNNVLHVYISSADAIANINLNSISI